ncbi:unnamed protein product [Closterium sp. NIES-53]
MVGAVVDTGVVDTLEAPLENTRRRHEANEYGDLPWAVVEAGIRVVWATEHPSRPVSPRPVNTEGGVDAGGDQVGSSAGGTSRQRGVIHADEVAAFRREEFGRRRLQAPRKATSEVDEAVSNRLVGAGGRRGLPGDGGSRAEKQAVVLLDSGFSHHLMGTKEVFVDLQPSNNVKHVRGFNGALHDVQGRGTVALQGEAERQENVVKLQEDGDEMLLVSTRGDVLGRAPYTGRVLCTDLRPCSAKSTAPTTEVVALRAIVSVATGLDLESASGPDLLCVSCVGGKLARHTFPDLGSDAKDVLAVVHTRYVWVRPFAKNSDALQEFVQWLAVVERQTKKSVLMLRSHRGGEFLGNQFTDFVNGKGIVHDLTCPYTPQQNGMAEREMRTVVESVRTMLLHIGVQHHWWHLALRQAAWILVPEQQRRGKLKPKVRWGLHLGVSAESKGWELLYLANNRVVTTSDVVFYENMSLEVWKSEHGPALGRMPSTPPTDTSTGTLPLLPEVGEPAAEDVEDASSPSPSSTPPVSPLVADLCRLTPVSASGDEGSSGASPNALTKSIAGGRRNVQQVDMRVMSTPAREERTVEVQLTMVKSAKGAAARQQPTGEHAAAKLTTEKSATGQSTGGPTSGEQSAGTPTVVQQDNEGSDDSDDGGEAVESTDSDVVEVQGGPRHTGRLRRPPDFFVPAAFTTMYDVDADDLAYNDAEDNDEMPEIDPDMPTLSTPVERPPGVNIMKNRWVLTTKYHIDDSVEREKARLVVKGFTQVYGADYDETYAPVSSYVTLRIFLSIVAILDLNLVQLDMKNAFMQMLGAGWEKSQVDTALYFKVGDGKVTCWVLVYVEDLLTASNSTKMLKELKELLEAAFELCEISPVQKYLGLEIIRDRLTRKLRLHQQGYADSLRRRFLDKEQTRRTPKTSVSVDANAELTFDDEEAQERQEDEYRQKAGSLQFAATTMRLDIAFACSKLGSSLTVRSDQHLHEVDRCFAYLANMRGTVLEFGGEPESLKLISYVDANDVDDKRNRTSTGGYVFVYGGAAISWSNQRIKCVLLSSTESEYVAATEAGKEGRRLRFLHAESRQLDAGTLIVLQVDNKLAITVAEGMGLTGNLKHMERRQA